jgi:hypothetical protein
MVLNLLLNNVLSSTAIVFIDVVVWVVIHQIVNAAIRKGGAEVFLKTKRDE